MRRQHVVEQLVHLLAVLAVYLRPAGLTVFLRLQFQHGQVSNETLHFLTDSRHGPGTVFLTHTGIEGFQIRRGTHVAVYRDISTHHIQALQEPLVLFRQKRILDATRPVVSHQLVVLLDDGQLFRGLRIWPRCEIGLRLSDDHADIALRELSEYSLQ